MKHIITILVAVWMLGAVAWAGGPVFKGGGDTNAINTYVDTVGSNVTSTVTDWVKNRSLLASVVITNYAYSADIQIPQTHRNMRIEISGGSGSSGGGYDAVVASCNGDTNNNYCTDIFALQAATVGGEQLYTNGMHVGCISGYGRNENNFSIGRAVINNYTQAVAHSSIFHYGAFKQSGNTDLTYQSGVSFWTNATAQPITSLFLRCRFGSVWTNGTRITIYGED